MKNIFYSLVLLTMVSCGSKGTSDAEKTEAPKLGKLEATKAKAAKFHFEINGKQLEEAKVPYGSPVTLIVEGAEGFKDVNGKVNCDGTIEVFNSKNERIAVLDKLFDEAYGSGMPAEKFNGLVEMKLTCQRPLKINETYKIVFTLKDKSGEGKLSVNEKFAMVPVAGLTYEEKGLISDGLFFIVNNGKEAIIENKLATGDTLLAYCSGLSGLVEENGMVRPDASIALYNAQNELLVDFKDLYKDYEKEGAPAATVKELIYLQLALPTMKPNASYYVLYSVGDKKGSGKLSVRYDFTAR